MMSFLVKLFSKDALAESNNVTHTEEISTCPCSRARKNGDVNINPANMMPDIPNRPCGDNVVLSAERRKSSIPSGLNDESKKYKHRTCMAKK